MTSRKPSPSRGGKRVHGEVSGPEKPAFEAVFEWVRTIPKGRVMTYGQIATLLGHRLSPRAVGWAMHGCPPGVPWQRVVNARGGCSTERMPDIPPGLQRALLESEGVLFGEDDTLDLNRYRWNPPDRHPPAPRSPAPRKGPAKPRSPRGR